MKLAILLCISAAVGAATACAETPRGLWPSHKAAPATVPAQPPGLPYVAAPSPTAKPRRAASWEELFQRNPGLRERVEALKKAHPEVKDWDSLFKTPGRPPTVNDLFNQFPQLRDFVAPRAALPQGTPRTRILIPEGQPPVVLTLPPHGPAQNPVYRPSDRALFKFQYPLLTPDTPVHLNPVKPSEPESAGIVELPVP